MAGMNYQSKSPPLYVWGIACLLVCMIAAAAFFLRGRSFIVQTKEKLHLFSVLNEKRVVAIGTSLLGQATFPDHLMSDFGREKGFDEFKFFQMTKGGMFLEDIFPSLNEITDAKPDVVVIESNLLLFTLDERERLNMEIGRHKKYLRYLVLRYLLSFTGSKPRETDFLQTRQDAAILAGKTEGLKKYRVRDDVFPEEIEDFFALSKKQKIKIIIADVPRYEKLEEVITKLPGNNQKMTNLIQDLKIKYGIEYLEYPEKLGLEYYMDFSHFNQKGRELYSLWLLSCLSKF